jgi:pimeloyl-ACP methyl ester carboxylesterase
MSLVHERRGSGEPLVLLHGIGHHWRAWEPVIDRLAETHDVIAVDLPGFGHSPMAENALPPGIPRVTASVAEFLDSLGLERPHVAGNSLGGAIALELAAAGRVASATALSPAGFASPGERRRALAVLAGHRIGAFTPIPVLRLLYRLDAGRAMSFGQLMARPRRLSVERALADTLALRGGKGYRMVAKAGRTYTFQRRPIGVPVTIAWGTRDRILPYSQAERARRLLPDARHVALDGCGHVPMSDDPERVAAVILTTTSAA